MSPTVTGVEGVDLPGPWQHQYVAANGARFHLATAGPERGPAVLLLHGFPQFWWTWRHQITALADAGHRVLAMDLRGYGGSDKPPRGYDPMTLADDVAGVIKTLALHQPAVVGHGWGGYVAWATATIHAGQVGRVLGVSAPHPLAMLRGAWRGSAAVLHVLAMQPPWVPERKIRHVGSLRRHLSTWSATPDYPSEEEVSTYAAALANWPSPHCSLEYHRWLFRSRLRDDGRRFRNAMRQRTPVPSYALFGEKDPVVPPRLRRRSAAYVSGEHRSEVIPGAGHFLPEEAPVEVTRRLLAWLD